MLRRFWPRSSGGKPSREEFVRRVIPPCGVGAELGVQHGDFARQLMDLARPRRLYLVDLWFKFGAEWYWEEGERRPTVEALKRVLDLFAEELVSGRAVLHIGDDLEFLAGCPAGHLDWAYIDSSHDYEHTRRELELLATKVNPGGLIAGDDWTEDADHPHGGVARAVREFVAGGDYELVYADPADLQWAVARA